MPLKEETGMLKGYDLIIFTMKDYKERLYTSYVFQYIETIIIECGIRSEVVSKERVNGGKRGLKDNSFELLFSS
jgi:hypothetical protein